MALLESRNPWLKLLATFAVAIPLAAVGAYQTGGGDDAVGAARIRR